MDEDGSIQVFEAVLVAIMILTAVLFFTALSRPSQAADSGGLDLGVLASDILNVLHERNFTDPVSADPNATLDLTQWVDRVVQGDSAVAAELDEFMEGVLGSGLRYLVRIDNGVEPLVILPYDRPAIPLAGRAASTFIVPDWAAFDAQTKDLGPYAPGQVAVDCSGWTKLTAPTGNQTGPKGQSWLAIWQDAEACGTATAPRIPDGALLGRWEYEATGCTPCHVDIVPSGRTYEGVAPYALQLMLWQGA